MATRDLKTYERLGPVTTDDHYDCNIILFPEKIKGQFVMLHRPSGFKAEIESGAQEVAGIIKNHLRNIRYDITGTGEESLVL